jgi:hypothetical protein
MGAMASSLEELAFVEAVRAASQQQAALEAVRTRAVAIATAASVTSGFLAGSILPRGDLDGWAVAGLVCLVLIGGLTGFVLYPRQWRFSNDVSDLVETAKNVEEEARGDELRAYLRSWAWSMQTRWGEQQAMIEEMGKAYGAATVLLVVLVVAWAGRLL